MKKFLLIFGIVLTVIVITFLVLVKLYITPERVKELVITTAEKSLNRKVNIGEIEVSLFKGIGIKDFAIKEADGKSNFISCEDFVLKYKLMPLLSKQVVIEELKLEAPTINIFRDSNGTYNFETIGAKKEEEIIEETTPGSPTALPLLLVKKIAINKATFTLKDATKKLPDIKSGADVKISIESTDGTGIITRGSLDLRFDEIRINTPPAKQIKDITAALKFAVHIDLETDTIRIDEANLTFQDIPISLKGEVNKFKSSPEINVALSLPEVDSAKLVSAVKPFINIKGLKMSGKLAVDTKLNGNVDNPDTFAVDLNLNLKNIGIKYDKVDSIINGNFIVDYKGDKLKIEKADFAVDGTAVSLTGNITEVKTSPYVNIALSLPDVNTSNLQKTLSPFIETKRLKLSGNFKADLNLRGRPDKLETIKASSNITLKDINIKYDKIDSVLGGQLKFNYQSNTLKISKADLILNGIAASIKGQVTGLDKSPEIDLALSLPKADTAKLLKTISPFVDTQGLKLSGTMKADIKIKGKPEKINTIKANSNIALNDINIKYDKIDSMLGGKFKFNYHSNSLKISKADFTFDGISASMTGQVTKIDKSPEIDLALSLPKADTAKLLKTISPFVDTQGLKLSGTMKANMKIKGKPEKIDTLKVDGKVVLAKIRINYDNISASLDGSIKFKKDTVTIKLKSTIGENTVDFNGTVQSYMKDQKINLNIYSKKLIIDDLLTLAGKEEKEPVKKGPPSSAAPQKEPEPMDLKLTAKGEVKVDAAVYQGFNMRNLLMKFNFVNNKLVISKMSAKGGKGRFDLNSTIDFSKPGYSYKLSSKLDSLHADEVVNAFFPKAKDTIFGILSFNFKLNGTGTLPKNLKKNLIADGDFIILDGKITDTGISEGLASFLNIRELETINLTKADGTVIVRKSVAKLNSFFESDDLTMDPKGDIGLDGTLNLAFDLKMSPDFTNKAMGSSIGHYIKNEDGSGLIPLIVKGTLSKPSYSVDVAKASKRVIKKEAEKFIDKLFDKKTDTGTPDQSTPDELAPVRELLKGLFQ